MAETSKHVDRLRSETRVEAPDRQTFPVEFAKYKVDVPFEHLLIHACLLDECATPLRSWAQEAAPFYSVAGTAV
jgi:hypothetical protein